MSSSEERSDWYDIVECSTTSTVEEIQSSIRKLSAKYHPDRNKAESAKLKFQLLQQAKAVLLDKEKRKCLDEKLTAAKKRKVYESQRTDAMDANRKKYRMDFEKRLAEVSKTKSSNDRTANNAAPNTNLQTAAVGVDRATKIRILQEEGRSKVNSVNININAQQESREREYNVRKCSREKYAELKEIRVKWKRNSLSHSDDSLYQIFKAYGDIKLISLDTLKGNAANIVFETTDGAQNAENAFANSSELKVYVVNKEKKSNVFNFDYKKPSNPLTSDTRTLQKKLSPVSESKEVGYIVDDAAYEELCHGDNIHSYDDLLAKESEVLAFLMTV